MQTISSTSMLEVQCGTKLSEDCIKSLVGEGISYASLFFVTGVLGGAFAVAGLVTSAIIMGMACS